MAGRKQFNVDLAVTRAALVFWRRGYADSSLDDLCEATGLGRSSIYGTFGGKDPLFRRALRSYSDRYGALQEAALASHPEDPSRAVEAFLDVTIRRILDPGVPTGCLITQSAAALDVLSRDSAEHVRALIDDQRGRIREALDRGRPLTGRALDDLTSFVVAVNQSLAVMSRAGASDTELHAIRDLAVDTVERHARVHDV
ncbi:TetR/AcrR family transcriptional regulator [Pseudonocardia spinosispora]|uniref:TetR/AcrR family transcriptional regulator n=1 Tax=Pseudonocardia spinosispora TaxID=103441 RepID=UPI00040CE794|nr:TetR/AcrR family transcriptional regulator [Pseudonocardia spinosispora]